jgi:hypothetical protein
VHQLPSQSGHAANDYSVLEKFRGLRWVPAEPEFLKYANAQFLMIGGTQNDLDKPATAEEGAKEPNQEPPVEEIEKFEADNEQWIEFLKGTFCW